MIDTSAQLLSEVTTRVQTLAERAAAGEYDEAVALLAGCITTGGVVQAFGTGHSEAFAMEIAGRAGGLIPTNIIRLRDLVLHGDRSVDDLAGAPLERDPGVAQALLATAELRPQDVFVIASNSGVNGSVVGLALAAQQAGHRVIAVTSLAHTSAVTPKHPSGKRLSEIADVVIDNLAPYGDTTLQLGGGDGPAIGVGAVSSVTAAFIGQLLTVGVAERIAATGAVPPIYLSANIPGGDEHNQVLEAPLLAEHRIRRTA